jgi:hypothetical protein
LGELQPVDLVVCGSVAVNREGPRVGKGGGFSDLEFALLVEAGLIGTETVVATTVHPQLLAEATAGDRPRLLPRPDRPGEEVIGCRRTRRPQGILWEHLDAAKVATIPALAAPDTAGPNAAAMTCRCAWCNSCAEDKRGLEAAAGAKRPSGAGSTRRGKPIGSPQFGFLTAGLVGVA